MRTFSYENGESDAYASIEDIVNIFNVFQFNDNINEYQYIFWELVSSGQSPIGVRLVQAYETFTQPLGNYHYS